MREADRNLTLMVQADMTAYHEPGEPQQLGFPETYVSSACCLFSQTLKASINSIGTREVTQLVANISTIYVPQLVVGFTPVRLRFIILLEPS